MRLTKVVTVLAVLAAAALAIVADAAEAQEPTLRPVSEHSDDGQYVARRCAALTLYLSVLMGDRADRAPRVQQLDKYAEAFYEMAVQYQTEYNNGDQELARRATMNTILSIQRILKERMDRNETMTGSRYAEDDLLMSDIRVCDSLGAKLTEGG